MHVLSFDCQSDVTSCGRHIRFFNVIDAYRRTALMVIPRRSFKATDVVAVLEGIIAETGIQPGFLRCNNGPEFTPGALVDWCKNVGVSTALFDPGSQWHNGFIESFNSQLRREQLFGEIMDDMVKARYLADEWKDIYNHERPHGSLDRLTPSRFWDEWVRENQLAIV